MSEEKIASQTAEELAGDLHAAAVSMQKRRWILSPGCSVPNDIAPEVLLRLKDLAQKG